MCREAIVSVSVRLALKSRTVPELRNRTRYSIRNSR